MLHADVCIKSKFLGFYNEHVVELSCPISNEAHKQHLKQAKLYRQRFAVIASVLPPTSLFHCYMCGMVGKLDQLMDDRQCDDVLQLLKKFEIS